VSVLTEPGSVGVFVPIPGPFIGFEVIQHIIQTHAQILADVIFGVKPQTAVLRRNIRHYVDLRFKRHLLFEFVVEIGVEEIGAGFQLVR